MPDIELRLFQMTDLQYQSGVALNNYQGNISLVSARQAEDGKIWMDYIFPQIRENGQNVPGKKSFPHKVSIGKGKDEAIKTLKYFLDILEGKEVAQPEPPMPEPPEDDIPPF